MRPDALPGEIWFKIGSYAQHAEFDAWRKVAPCTVAKGMHAVGFARSFERLTVDAQERWNCPGAIHKLEQYAREPRLRDAVRDVVVLWAPRLSSSSRRDKRGQQRFVRSLSTITRLLCNLLACLEPLRSIQWSAPMSRRGASPGGMPANLFCALRLHLPSLRSLDLQNLRFVELDLTAAIFIEELRLRHVELECRPDCPSLEIDISPRKVELCGVTALVASTKISSDQDSMSFASTDSSTELSDVAVAIDLSRSKDLTLSTLSLTPADAAHLFPPAPNPRCPGKALKRLSLACMPKDPVLLEALSSCSALQSLAKVELVFAPSLAIMSSDCSSMIVSACAAFLERQTALEDVRIGLSLEPLNRPATLTHLAPTLLRRTFERALDSAELRGALASLPKLSLLEFSTPNLSPDSAIDWLGPLARALPKLEALTLHALEHRLTGSAAIHLFTTALGHFSALRLYSHRMKCDERDQLDPDDSAPLARALFRNVSSLEAAMLPPRGVWVREEHVGEGVIEDESDSDSEGGF